MDNLKKINYQNGDLLEYQSAGRFFIAHICNHVGAFGKGFALALSNKWQSPRLHYRTWYQSKLTIEQCPFELGEIQLVKVEEHITVVNMLAQFGLRSKFNPQPIRYEALEKCLEKLTTIAPEHCDEVIMPRIGTGLAGGNWDLIEPIIKRTLIAGNVNVRVFEL